MREACAIAATVLEQLKPLVRPGITTQDLEEAGRDWIARLGARSACFGYQNGSRRYPAHTCIPSTRRSSTASRPFAAFCAMVISFPSILSSGMKVSSATTLHGSGRNSFLGCRQAAPRVTRGGPPHRGHHASRSAIASATSPHAIQQYVEANGFSVVRDHGRSRSWGLDARGARRFPNFGRRGTGDRDQARHDARDRAHGERRRIQDEDALGWLDGCDGGRIAFRALRTHGPHHGARSRDPHDSSDSARRAAQVSA
jgi:methionyl aminopeptidase